jgi:rfaE bifunctional protein kinase chain/domain
MSDARLAALLDRFPALNVAVVGDLMLDRYVWGTASRISQEAPVPVVTVNRETETPGGAANVVNNISTLGGRTAAYGIIGDDAHGRALTRLLLDCKAHVHGIVSVPGYPTTVKTRVIANHQQVVRIDHENTEHDQTPALNVLQRRLAEDVNRKMFDALIFEDYAKGLLNVSFIQEIINLCVAAGVPTALDPHPSHAFKVKGLTLMTPNRAEAFGLAGVYFAPGVLPLERDKPLLEVGKRLQDEWEVQNLLITLGADGMALFRPQKPPLHIPTRARSVFDVSGAGDTVMASFMLALAAGAAPEDAAVLSNHAAGIVVAKVGTVPVTAAELKHSLERQDE